MTHGLLVRPSLGETNEGSAAFERTCGKRVHGVYPLMICSGGLLGSGSNTQPASEQLAPRDPMAGNEFGLVVTRGSAA